MHNYNDWFYTKLHIPPGVRNSTDVLSLDTV